MKIELAYAELHAPLFLGGKNHQMKLKAGSDMRLVYDRDEKELIIIWGKHVAIVPFHGTTNNVWPKDPQAFLASIELPPVEATAPTPIKAPHVPPKSAQVSSPQAHVFAGPGGGKSR